MESRILPDHHIGDFSKCQPGPQNNAGASFRHCPAYSGGGGFRTYLGSCNSNIFAGIQAGGELIAMQMGFSMLQFADPTTNTQVGVISHMLFIVTSLIFLMFDGHIYLLKAFIETYKYIPAGGLFIGQTIFNQIFLLANMLFSLALKIIAPVLAAIFLTELGLAFMGRMAPQMHIMELGFPLKILVGFFFLGSIFQLLTLDIQNYIIPLTIYF